MAKTPDERRARRAQLENEFIDNIEQVLGFYLMEWQKEILLNIRRSSLEGKPIDVKALVDEARRR